jgi:hypothetical protein
MATVNDKRIAQLEKQIATVRETIQTQGGTPELRQRRDALVAELQQLRQMVQAEPVVSTADEALQKYGFAYGLIQSDPSLQALFERATNTKTGVYTAERFEAELRTTDWYKNNSLAKRNYEILRTGDPAEFAAKQGQWTTWVTEQARATGASISQDQARTFADQIMSGGLDPNKATQIFATTYIDYSSADLLGRAGALQDEVSNLNSKYGNILGQSQINNYVEQILTGKAANSDILDTIKRTAAGTYSNFSDRIMAGESVEDVASPYKNLMQQYLELADVDLQDGLMLDALSGKGEKGGMKYGSLSDFRKAVKNDARWQYTDNAREEYFGIAQKVLADFGFLG